MVTIYKIDKDIITNQGKKLFAELRGLSTDTKPTQVDGKQIGNGSAFIEIDTQKIYFFDEASKTWKEA